MKRPTFRAIRHWFGGGSSVRREGRPTVRPGVERVEARLLLTASPAGDPADLEVTSISLPTGGVGTPVTQVFQVTNKGPDTATNVVLTDVLAQNMTLLGSSPAGTVQSGTLTIPLGTLLPMAFRQVSVQVSAAAPGTYNSSIQVASDVTDLNLANNVITAGLTIAAADLAVTALPTLPAVPVTVPFVMSYQVTNNGPDATTVTLTDAVPAGLTVIGSSPAGALQNGVLTVPVGMLNSGASATVSIEVTPDVVGTFNNTVQVTGTVTDPNPANNTATTTVNAQVFTTPHVVSVRRLGIHNQPTRVVVGFSTPLDPRRAQDVNNYQIVSEGPTRINGGLPGFVDPVRTAVYNPANDTVTLTPWLPLQLKTPYQFTVVGTTLGYGSGIADPNGLLLNSLGPGTDGTNFVTTLRGFGTVPAATASAGATRLRSAATAPTSHPVRAAAAPRRGTHTTR